MPLRSGSSPCGQGQCASTPMIQRMANHPHMSGELPLWLDKDRLGILLDKCRSAPPANRPKDRICLIRQIWILYSVNDQKPMPPSLFRGGYVANVNVASRNPPPIRPCLARVDSSKQDPRRRHFAFNSGVTAGLYAWSLNLVSTRTL